MVIAGTEIRLGSAACKLEPPGCSSDCPGYGLGGDFGALMRNNPTRSYFSSEVTNSGLRMVRANGIPDHQFERDAENLGN